MWYYFYTIVLSIWLVVFVIGVYLVVRSSLITSLENKCLDKAVAAAAVGVSDAREFIHLRQAATKEFWRYWPSFDKMLFSLKPIREDVWLSEQARAALFYSETQVPLDGEIDFAALLGS
ncbi:hypothetical protein [Robiginitalea biformata]|uniref:Uncharacterized protein n=1 Tax=Robiginitalea biformata (strain ATCC BAA-864 / DSM 15991 / KCTC 12146 / HTCC2501) TaxID=313596 RepID=A4CKL7_ROBBH|nr:hypothetical protein [Robiginitalea biformata]EAR15416.1 hypothetical protein RB2501_13849 [Robiginitalea biformata HTCC2501]